MRCLLCCLGIKSLPLLRWYYCTCIVSYRIGIGTGTSSRGTRTPTSTGTSTGRLQQNDPNQRRSKMTSVRDRNTVPGTVPGTPTIRTDKHAVLWCLPLSNFLVSIYRSMREPLHETKRRIVFGGVSSRSGSIYLGEGHYETPIILSVLRSKKMRGKKEFFQKEHLSDVRAIKT